MPQTKATIGVTQNLISQGTRQQDETNCDAEPMPNSVSAGRHGVKRRRKQAYEVRAGRARRIIGENGNPLAVRFEITIATRKSGPLAPTRPHK